MIANQLDRLIDFPPFGLFKGLDGAKRAVAVHPMLPPHLMPNATIYPGPAPAPQAGEQTVAPTRSTGHMVMPLTRETPDLVLSQLQFALIAKACQSIDRGDRCACLGPLRSAHLMGNSGFEGQSDSCGPATQTVMRQLTVTEPWSDGLAVRTEIAASHLPPAIVGPRA